MSYRHPFWFVYAQRSFIVSRASFFCGFEPAKIVAMPVKFYACDIFFGAFIEAHAFITRGVIALRTAISMVLRWRSVAQIFPAIIRLILFTMIDLVFRPASFHVEVRKPMSHVFVAGNTDFDSLTRAIPSNVASTVASPERSLPSEDARLWVVMQNRFKKFGREIGMGIFSASSRHALFLACTLLAFFVVSVNTLYARDLHPFDPQHFASQDDQRDYFNGLTNGDVTPNEGTGRGALCCSSADGVRLADPDWTNGVEIKGEKCVYAVDDERNHRTGTKYCVKVEGVWYIVPDIALVQQPNRIGTAEVWPAMSSPEGRAVIVTRIRCFMPGTLG